MSFCLWGRKFMRCFRCNDQMLSAEAFGKKDQHQHASLVIIYQNQNQARWMAASGRHAAAESRRCDRVEESCRRLLYGPVDRAYCGRTHSTCAALTIHVCSLPVPSSRHAHQHSREEALQIPKRRCRLCRSRSRGLHGCINRVR